MSDPPSALYADEHAALRRVAAVVAAGAGSADVFAVVTEEVGRALGLPYVDMLRYEPDGTATVIGAWGERAHPFEVGTRWALDGPTVTARVHATGAPVRVDDYGAIAGAFADAVRASGIRAAAGAPIVVDGALWGVMVTAADRGPLPQRIEQRLGAFTELVATALSQSQAREQLRRLVEEQSALRRVATLVAQGLPPEAVFAAVAAEAGRLAGTEMAMLSRFDHDGTATVVGALGEHPFRPGVRWSLDGPSAQRTALETGKSVRSDAVAEGRGAIADASREHGLTSRVAVPIVVDGRVWGVIGTAGAGKLLPAGIETRLEEFSELVAIAISNTQTREERALLADEQSALRRVATLVAHGAPPTEVFHAVAAAVGKLAGAHMVLVSRAEGESGAAVVGAWGDHPLKAGARWTFDGPSISRTVLESGRSARTEEAPEGPGAIADVARALGVHSRVGVPIVVNGEVWGVIAAGAAGREPLAAGIETRLEQFTELAATAISNTQAREDLQRLADEQAALRRLATLVAHGAEPRVVFDAVAEETGRLLGATTVNLAHFTPDAMNVTISGWSLRGVHVPPGSRLPIDGGSINALVRSTACPCRCDNYEATEGRLAARLRELGIRSEVGAPVVVDGRVWGALIAGTDDPEPLPPGTEHRLAEFAELVATAVANATARGELVASRVRIVEAADEQRRRVVRDLHDGAQQRLVHAAMTLQLAAGRGDAPPEVHSVLEDTRAAIVELRELAHGLHPAILTDHGLTAAVEALADRAPLPVAVDIPEERLSRPVESAAYFVAAETLTNVAKYAHAKRATITAASQDGRLVLVVADDGVGGAIVSPGGGLAGLEDRVAALAGRLAIDSPPGAGTTVRAEIPLG